MPLTNADVLYLRDATLADLREELYYTSDAEYARALIHAIVWRERGTTLAQLMTNTQWL